MSNIVPDYSKFDEIKLMKLYGEIQGLNEVAAEKLLKELHARNLMESSNRVEVKFKKEEKERIDSVIQDRFRLTQNEFINVKAGYIVDSFKERIKFEIKRENTSTAIGVPIISAIFLGMFFIIQREIDLFDHREILDLSKIIIVAFGLVLPLVLIFASLWKHYQTKSAMKNWQISSIDGKPILKTIRTKRGKIHYINVRNKSFAVNSEQQEVFNEQFRYKFYFLSKRKDLLTAEVEGKGEYKVLPS